MEYLLLFLFVSLGVLGISLFFNTKIEYASDLRRSLCPPHKWTLRHANGDWLDDGEQNLDKIANSRLQCRKCLGSPNSDPRPPTGEYE